MSAIWPRIRSFFVSLRLTVVLLLLALLLVFAATYDQRNISVWEVQKKWFYTFFVHGNLGGVSVPLFPGGYLISAFLFLNLVAAHVYRFRFSLKKIGVILLHFGLILLLAGEFFSGLWQQDYGMNLNVGQTGSYAESFHDNELAIADVSGPGNGAVTSIPEDMLARGGTIQAPSLPFSVVVRRYFPNAAPQMAGMGATVALTPPLATAGAGTQLVIGPLNDQARDPDKNTPAGYIELVGAGGKSLGIWLVAPAIDPQTFSYQGKTWSLSLRPARLYLGFSLQLLSVTNDYYPGSDIPKNFISHVLLREGKDTQGREVTIYMNNPLRHEGLTFYQNQMTAAQGNSVFQVVRNPAAVMPYISCSIITIGMLIQFCTSLVVFIRKRGNAAAASAKTAGGRQATTA